jgi:hypothetical protein
MATDKTWGDHIILDASSRLYGVEFIIMESHKDFEITHIPTESHVLTVYLGHIGEFHYVVVVPKLGKQDLSHINAKLHTELTPKSVEKPFKRFVSEKSTSPSLDSRMIDYGFLLSVMGIDAIENVSSNPSSLVEHLRGYDKGLELLFKVGPRSSISFTLLGYYGR